MTSPTATAPERSLTQRLDALQEANRVRCLRAQLKRDLKAGRRHGIEVLANPPEWAATMKVIDVLLAMPKIGRVKASGALRRTQTSPAKTLGGLSPRQRGAIVTLLVGEWWRR
ncbi:MAG TPA: hypothetical protein VFZ00_01535 [Solirubrobacter sp.]|nr:hypothetical protein [Solirubrobacter sp.]